MFGWGYSVYNSLTRTPADAYEVRVIGKQWLWQFQYDDGKTTVNELYVPVNKPVKLVMTSDDVLHSFFIPNFRVKQDVVPGMYSSVWFEANVPGKHQVYCTEYCGTSHSQMLAQVIVLSDQQWADWKRGKKIGDIPRAADGAGQPLAQGDTPAPASNDSVKLTASAPMAAQGKQLMMTKGCVACHSDDGTTKVGPTFKGAWGHEVAMIDGSKVKVDENYIRESIMKPQAKLVKGYGPVMPTFAGLINESEMNSIISYIQSLKQ
jgi:cytochrome c oxidase subunit 2